MLAYNLTIGYNVDMKKNINAVKLGSIKTEKKSKSSAENGKNGGRPHKHGFSTTRFGKIWYRMKSRCSDKSRKHYYGKGIKVEWESFEEFKEDMYAKYLEHVEIHGEKNTTIDRIDNDGNYSKENCRWATHMVQCNNKSNNFFHKEDGKEQTLRQWSQETGINYKTMLDRKYRGRELLGSTERKNLHSQRERELCEFEGCIKKQESYGICKKCGHNKYDRYCSRHRSKATRLSDSSNLPPVKGR